MGTRLALDRTAKDNRHHLFNTIVAIVGISTYIVISDELSYWKTLSWAYSTLLQFSPYASESLNKLVLRLYCNMLKLLFARTGWLHQRTS